MDELPVRNPFVIEVVVDDAHIDGQGHLSNVAVLDFMNQAAYRHSISLGYDAAAYQRLGAMFVVRRHEIDYHRISFLGDRLTCYTWPSAIGKITAERRHRIVRAADDAVIAEGFNRWAYVDAKSGRPARIPPEVRDTFDPAKFV